MKSENSFSRKTRETEIKGSIHVYGKGDISINTGTGFFDHLLNTFAFFSGMDLKLTVKGDLQVDDHHTVEDTGIVLGQALNSCCDKNTPIHRYGFYMLSMDEVLTRVTVDVSGRSFLDYNADFSREVIGGLALENIKEFFLALVREAGMTLHIDVLKPGNDHHQAESIFKCFGKALQQAVSLSQSKVQSTKYEDI